MQSLLDYCRDLTQIEIASGDVLLREGERSGKLYVLADGTIEVFRGEVEIAHVSEPGAVFGEMSVLLNLPHTASVRAATPAKLHVIENAPEFLRENPEAALPIATLLAKRLQNANDYLVNLKLQYQDREDHLGMVDEVLESLINQQDGDFVPADDLPREP